ncbi:MAG TPA: transcription antitermination factor NusB [Lachnospiraceae bacterium]|nr:transcription antitermination factor NusB [Lachnospiraceae bacterium]
MSRRQLREHIFKLLFRIEFNSIEDMPEQVQIYMEDLWEEPEAQLAYIHEKFEKIVAKLPEIDAIIEDAAEGWNKSRMGKVDLTIIRLAVYEIMFDDDIPVSVAINEAVELAKRFGQDESSSFVNGVLSKVLKKAV